MNDLVVKGIGYLDWGPFSFEVGAGECLGVTGDSGSGKSLLLRALADLDPNTGQVLLGETERTAVPAPEWRRRIGMLPAETEWWYDTVGEHFEPIDGALLQSLGLSAALMPVLPGQLSAGERQRLAVLRLLSRQPRALLLDEPSANLDADNTRKLEDLIASYRSRHQAPVIWISHDTDQIPRVADRHLRMHDRQLTPVEMP